MPTAAKSSRIRRPAGRPAPRPKRRPAVTAPWSLRHAGSLEIIELAPFKKLPWLVHGFSTRSGGASVLPSGEPTLNLSFTDWDKRENVLQNRARFQSAIGAKD